MGKRGRKRNVERINDILEAYYAGENVAMLAKQLSITTSNIYKTVKRFGRGSRTPPKIKPYRRTRLTARQKFWSKVDQSAGPDACWHWIGSMLSSGYGRFYCSLILKRTYAHHAAFLFGYGKRAKMNVLHRCGNRSCCNPAHLYDGTLKQNAADRSRHCEERGTTWSVVTSIGHGVALDERQKVIDLLEQQKPGKIAERFSMRRSTIYSIRRRERAKRATLSSA
jgi:hypothetical protein